MKTIEGVEGFKKNCPNYEPCPLCYGCRAYDASYYECAQCAKNKQNICDRKRHTDRALNKMYGKKEVLAP